MPRGVYEHRFRPFDDYVDKSSDCWMWTGARSSTGYGAYAPRRGAQVSAHRHSWERANGPIPDGLWVLHRCDNPPCVRPDHLFLGTARDNTLDMVAKGRAQYGFKPGERHPLARRTQAEVDAMRARYQAGERVGKIAASLGLNTGTVSQIVSGKLWAGGKP